MDTAAQVVLCRLTEITAVKFLSPVRSSSVQTKYLNLPREFDCDCITESSEGINVFENCFLVFLCVCLFILLWYFHFWF